MKDKYPDSFKDVKCDIIGMGISNIALAKYLHKEGAKLYLRDKSFPTPENTKLFEDIAVKCYYGEKYLDGLTGDFIFRTPSLRPDVPEFTHACKRGSILGAEWELFFYRTPCKTIGVTGSDGKTTTVTITEKLLSHAFRNTDRRAYSAGNIGTPLVSLLDKLKTDDVVVAELSSFQLMTLDRSPDVAAITNITPNHLDYHENMEEYVTSKLNIAGNGCNRLVIHDTEEFKKYFKKNTQAGIQITNCGIDSKDHILNNNGTIFQNGIPTLDIDSIATGGKHNVQNYMTAIGLCGDMVTKDDIFHIAQTFTGVEHRAQLVAEIDGIRYYDSSIDSTPSRTAATLSSLTAPLTVICGGYDKNLEYGILADALQRYAQKVIITGASAPKILSSIKTLPAPSFEYVYIPDFLTAVNVAKELTPIGGAVVLSPACASFDQFKDYKERSRTFLEAIHS